MSVKFGVRSVLVVMLLALALEQGDAAWIRVRRVWDAVKKPACTNGCAYGCVAVTSGWAAPLCGVGCKEVCGRIKRDVNEIFKSDDDIVIIPMSRDFHHYDSNKDGAITVEEFANGLGVGVESGDVRKAFNLADRNENDQLSFLEFEEAPFVFDEGDFNSYDSNKDRSITVEEFANALGIEVENGELHKAFDLADRNGDGRLSFVEFEEAPFVFDEGDTSVE